MYFLENIFLSPEFYDEGALIEKNDVTLDATLIFTKILYY